MKMFKLSLVLLIVTHTLHSAQLYPRLRRASFQRKISLITPAIYTVAQAHTKDCADIRPGEWAISEDSLKAMLKRDLQPSDKLVHIYKCYGDSCCYSGTREFIPLDKALQGKEGRSIELIVYGAKSDYFFCQQTTERNTTPWEDLLKEELEAFNKKQEALEANASKPADATSENKAATSNEEVPAEKKS